MAEIQDRVLEISLEDLVVREAQGFLGTGIGKIFLFVVGPLMVFNSICGIVRFLGHLL